MTFDELTILPLFVPAGINVDELTNTFGSIDQVTGTGYPTPFPALFLICIAASTNEPGTTSVDDVTDCDIAVNRTILAGSALVGVGFGTG